jgi:hypothetical protein
MNLPRIWLVSALVAILASITGAAVPVAIATCQLSG